MTTTQNDLPANVFPPFEAPKDATVILTGQNVCVEPYLYVRPVVFSRPGDEWVKGGTEYVVHFQWHSTRETLDRPDTGGISAGANLSNAKRLAAATSAGRVFTSAAIVKDIHRQTYVAAEKTVMGRYLNADLRKIGF